MKKILLAEDEVHIARAIMMILKKGVPGFTVDHAKNGAEAWEMAKSGDYQIIISDWNMPKKDGDELLADLRANECTAVTPFIMLTAKGDKDSVAAALEAGANEYVIKPFKTPEFIAKVKNVIGAGAGDSIADKSPVELVVDKFKQGFVKLPVLPEILVKLNELFERNDVTIDELARLVELDAAIASQLIKVANSPFARGSSDCISVDKAITRLGLDETKSYVMALSSKGILVSDNKILNEELDELWWHSLATAYCAKLLAKKLDAAKSDKLFFLGLMHDIGKLLLVSIVDDLSKSSSVFTAPAVKEVMERLHSEFGSKLLKSWEYDDEFQNVIRFHHAPFNSESVSFELMVIYLANLMVRKIDLGEGEESIENVASSQAAIKLGVTGETLAAVLEQTNESVASIKQML